MKRAFVTLALLATAATAANWPERPTLRAVRASQPPVVDGNLTDPAWQNAPEFTDFTQHDPNDGEPSTMPTSIRIVYDDDAIYFGLKLTDPARPSAPLMRRDSFSMQSDFVSINLDPRLDRLSGTAFTVTPTNVQIDSILYNDIGEDGSWDGVWDSATSITAAGWYAEVRIPYSQLRFPDKPVHRWGINVTRRTVRNNEWVRIVNTRKGETGFVSHFADIEGLEGIRRGKPLEIVPYAVARSDFESEIPATDPFTESVANDFDGGLDVKYALTSDLTLTGTINPDFGQVEVDPAVVNLSEFETFFPEKRPFFTEGSNIFRFDDSPAPAHFNFMFPPQAFYSRRIGRQPQLIPNSDAVAFPASTTILGAAKLTGNLDGGWSVGVLDAVTDSEDVRFVGAAGEIDRHEAEPMTNYFLSRVTKSLGSDSRVGLIATSVERNLSDDSSALRSSAMSVGIDAYTSWSNKAWVLEGSVVGSRVEGSPLAIQLTQLSPARYYQRPDAGHIELDATRTSLTGWGARAMLSKATGRWRPNLQVRGYSPGYETGDLGFMQRTDMISAHAVMQYVNEDPTPRYRDKNVWFGTWQNSNFDGDVVERGMFADHFATLSNYWTYGAQLFVGLGGMSDRLTRGGPLVEVAPTIGIDVSVGTDRRKNLVYEASVEFEEGDDGSYEREVGVEISARPRPNLSLSVAPSYSRGFDYTQYVTFADDPTATRTFGRRYIFADLHQREFELATRVDWTLRPTLSFQLFLQPFIASGDYDNYHSLVASRTRDYEPYGGTVADRDFNFRSVRGSAVTRWEFRPGSALYVVWNENRADVAPIGNFSFARDLRAIPDAPSHDVFLVKVSYWIPL